MADLSDLVEDDQFLLNGLLCGAGTSYRSQADGTGFDFFPAPESRQNDQPNPAAGVIPGVDTSGGRLLTLDGEYYVESPTTVMDLRGPLGSAFQPGIRTVTFDFTHQGSVWTYFGRPRGVQTTPGSGSWEWAGEFMCTEPVLYGPELGPFDVDSGGITVDPGGTAYSNQWSVTVVGPCTTPVVFYPCNLNGTLSLLPLTYPTITSGQTLVVSGMFQDIARAYVDNGTSKTPVLGREGDGRPARLLPVPNTNRDFQFESSGGQDTAQVRLRDAFA